jgi:hypothetical protein
VQVAGEWFKKCRSLPVGQRLNAVSWVLGSYVWLMGSRGQAKTALAELDRWLFVSPGVYSDPSLGGALLPTLLERARLQALLKNPAGAEKDLDTYLRLAAGPGSRAHFDYRLHGEVHLLRGFLAEQRGDRSAALAAWREGALKAWWKRAKPRQPADSHKPSRFDILCNLIVSSLADDLSEADARQALDDLLAAFATTETGRYVKTVNIPPAALREMWRSRRGREYARKIAFHEISYPEYVKVAPFLLAQQMMRQGAFASELSADQDSLLWALVEDTYAQFRSGKVGKTTLLVLGVSWKGEPGLLGWGAASRALSPALRGPWAYVMGHRYLHHHKKPRVAVTMFRTALADAPADSLLKRLAQAELDKREPKPGK